MRVDSERMRSNYAQISVLNPTFGHPIQYVWFQTDSTPSISSMSQARDASLTTVRVRFEIMVDDPWMQKLAQQ